MICGICSKDYPGDSIVTNICEFCYEKAQEVEQASKEAREEE